MKKLPLFIGSLILSVTVVLFAQAPQDQPGGQGGQVTPRQAGTPGQPPLASGPGAAVQGPGPGGAAAPGRAGRGRGPNFPQQTRPLASPDVLARGKAVYETNCASCHASDLRGAPGGISLLRSGVALSDQHGELISAAVAKHSQPITLQGDDPVAVSEYIHSILAQVGTQASPPGRADGSNLNILVGDAQAGQADFQTYCASCHSVTGDLTGIGSKYSTARALQNAWVAGSGESNPFGGRGAGGAGNPVTVTMPNGEKIQGTLIRKDDFLVVLTLPDSTRRSIPLNGDVPNVEVKDPKEAHKKMILAVDDPDNKHLHDITAYLNTIK